ncbi:hypothetical protein KUTeg_013353 [Tegillarca granosa]|uniref:SH2 domain-containing protein n=1 Tax=Tegillarca granosa TaxID=220873 RepID=A0ABQ9ETG3_TEGGR|nr:hypothetical protein KUTeg_013353 [Tegillarca granosa]
MLNNIASDLDLLLNDLCHIHPYQDSANSTKFKTFGKGQNYSDSSPGFGEDSAFGTLASTDSFNSDQKLRSDSIQSSHLEVFGLNHQTHPIWCLPDVGRSGAVHLLKDREIGTFIVRNSSQPNTMALSVQFPENGQQNVDHYLIESTPDGFRLNGSLHFFKAIPELLAYYCENIDELPHKLLPLPAIRNARTLQELVSLSHLGQDLWTSSKFEKGSISNLSSTSGNVHAALHKSVSEPINITNACKLSQSNHSIPVTLPSPLVQNLSNTSTTDTGSQVDGHSSSKSSHSVDSLLNRVGNCNVPLHLSKSKSDSAFSMHEGSALCEMCGSKISSSSQSRTVSQASSVNSGENSRSNSSHSSLKNKSTLYFTTPIELLHIPENQYFKSELSDKMSDYEDIWRSSAAHTPMSSMKNTPVPSVRHSLVSSTGPNISVDLSASHVEASTLNNMCSPDLKEIPQKIISTSLHNDLNNSQQLNFKSKNNLQRALSLDEASNQNCQKTSIDIDTLSERGLTKAETKSTTSVCTQTSPVVVKHKPPNLKSVNRDSNEQNSGDRKSNSSTSTVVSSLKSPVYAEPFDALSPSSAVKEMGVYVPRVRRRSAPSMGAQSRKLRAISHNPTLETIFSPDCDNTQNFEFKENGAINERLMNSEFTPPPSGMRRTQSAKVRSTRDRDKISHPLSKENLEEVKAKLESLNTKRKVKRTQSENIKQTNTEGLNLRSVKKELKLLEEYSEKGKTTATSTLRKFPVYQRHISIESSTNSDADWSTMEDMISQNNPGLTVKPIKNLLLKSNYRVMSEYDNLSNQYAAPSAKSRASTGTVFCKPWDNSLLDKLMVSSDPKLAPPMDLHERILSWQIHNEKYSGSSNEQGTTTDSEHVCEPEQGGGNQNNQQCLPAVFVQPPSSRDSTTETITECKGEILSSSHQTLKVQCSDDEGVKSESGEETLAVPVGLKNPVIQSKYYLKEFEHFYKTTCSTPLQSCQLLQFRRNYYDFDLVIT